MAEDQNIEEVMDDMEQTDERFVVELEDLFRIASGLDDSGIPNAGATLAIDEAEDIKDVTEDTVKTVANMTITESEFQIYASGGCVVLQIAFNYPLTTFFNRAVDICEEWMEYVNKGEAENKYLSLTVLPAILEGQITLLFTDLVYFTTVDTGQQNLLVLCFDNLMTQAFETEGIDYEQIKKEVDAELARQDEMYKQMYEDALDQLHKLEQEDNEYQESLDNDYFASQLNRMNDSENQDEESKPKKSYGIRFTKD